MIRISKIFHIEYGNQADMNKLEITSSDNGVRFISRSSKNLGFQGYVKPVKGLKVYKKGDITVTLGGTYLLSAFVQPRKFYTAQNIKVLTPKIKMTEAQKYFYCYAISHNRFRYISHGREANKTLDDIKVPSLSEIPKWIKRATKVNLPSNSAAHQKDVSLQDRNWDYFGMGELFEKFEKCKCSNASKLLNEGDEINYIGAKKSDNGFMQRVKKVDKLVSNGNCAVFIGDGQGSIGFATYQENDFIGSTTLTCGYHSKLNRFNALFIVTVLDLERYRYSFGRKYGKDQIKKAKIKLPTNREGDPDWDFMEYYIKSLPYSSNLKEKNNDKGLSDEELVKKYESGGIDFEETLKPALKIVK